MSELIDRLSDRLDSDLRRGIPFVEGMKHFTDFCKEVIKEMDMKLYKMEQLAKKRDR